MNVPEMTLDEFKDWYAKNSKLTVPELRAFGLRAVPCDCGEGSCQGWQMIHERPRNLEAVSET